MRPVECLTDNVMRMQSSSIAQVVSFPAMLSLHQFAVDGMFVFIYMLCVIEDERSKGQD